MNNINLFKTLFSFKTINSTYYDFWKVDANICHEIKDILSDIHLSLGHDCFLDPMIRCQF